MALAGSAAAQKPADSIVAVVGEHVILASELAQTLDFARIAALDTTTPDSALAADLLGRMIDDQILSVQAERESIEVPEPEVAAEVAENIRTLAERFGGEERFKEALANEGLTDKTLRQRYTDESRRRLLSRRLMEKEGLTQIYISPAEAERFYNERKDSIARVPGRVRLAHILVAVTPALEAESAGQRRMAEVMDVLARGGDFATVASSFSDDKKTAATGGDWGWLKTADLAPELSMVVSQLKPGQVSPPFRVLDGYFTLRLDERSGDRVRIRSLLVKVPVTRADTARARQSAESIRSEALAGASFDSLARDYSSDPITADSGGYLGEFMLEGMTEPFRSVVATLDSGAISEPVLSEHGFHIIMVLSKQTERQMTYLEMQDGIRNYLYQQRLAERLQSYLDRIAKNIYVRRYQ